MFIQQAPAAILSCPLMKTQFTSTATTQWILMVLIYTIEFNLSQGLAFCPFEDISSFMFDKMTKKLKEAKKT